MYVGADVEEPDGADGGGTAGAYLMCIYELPINASKKDAKEATIGILVRLY